MNSKKLLFVLAAALLATTSASAWDHYGGHRRVGVYIGAPMSMYWGPAWGGTAWGPSYYPPSYYSYYPPPVVVAPQTQSSVYIERSEPADGAEQQQYWYYCKSAKGYYPYVKECPQGWQKVLPQPEK